MGFVASKPSTKPEVSNADNSRKELKVNHNESNDKQMDKNYNCIKTEERCPQISFSNKSSKEKNDAVKTPNQDTKASSTAPDVTMAMQRERTRVEMGRRYQHVIDTRARVPEQTCAPHVPHGALWVDDSFPFEVAMAGNEDVIENVVWMRPGARLKYRFSLPEAIESYVPIAKREDFAPAPRLCIEGTTRFDVGQGSLGTCYFLSVLSSLADVQHVISQVLVDDYCIGTPEYRGVFHCRFWRLGEWHDVYVDDLLPVHAHSMKPWGAHSKTDPNEMWVSLMEKAFAKFHGSYYAAEGGHVGAAFTALTGGLAELLTHRDVTSTQLHGIASNALRCHGLLASSVAEDRDGEMGLEGGHAYSLTGTDKVEIDNQTLELFRLRNPWGTGVGEWRGPWSDNAPEWHKVDSVTRERLQVEAADDGEFWMSGQDFVQHFSDTTVCNLTPDFNLDGKQDNLNKMSLVLGEWRDITAGGPSFPQMYNNPRYMMNIEDNRSGSETPILIQMCQPNTHPNNQPNMQPHGQQDILPIKLNLYRVIHSFSANDSDIVFEDVTNKDAFTVAENITYRYQCKASRYVLIPHTIKPGQQGQFMLRIFSPQRISVTVFVEAKNVFIYEPVKPPGDPSNPTAATILSESVQFLHGQWTWRNSGGQIGHQGFDKNPQYSFTLPDTSEDNTYMTLSLKQSLCEAPDAIGIKLYEVDDTALPLPTNYLRKQHFMVSPCCGGNAFLQSHDVTVTYRLSAGPYCAIVFTDQPGTERPYVLSVECEVALNMTSHNVCARFV